VIILVVEDNAKSAALMVKALETEGHSVQLVHDGTEALAAIRSTSFDGVVLDIMLTGISGLEILRSLRAEENRTPVLLVSARAAVNEKVEGLDAGADDYLPKPFAVAEFVARVRALVRRGPEPRAAHLIVGDLLLDTASRNARRGGRLIELTPREYRLLEFLMRSVGCVCSRATILEKVWDYDFDPGSNIVEVYVAKLREKINDESGAQLLHNVRGVGYVMRENP
jgi:two-component system, OmpR family, response regulator